MYNIDMYHRSGLCLRLKVRVVDAELAEVLMHRSVTPRRNKVHKDKVRYIQHTLLPRCIVVALTDDRTTNAD